jgi:hypothetical protein
MTENVFVFLGRAIWRPIMAFAAGAFIWSAFPQSGVSALIMTAAGALFLGDGIGAVIGEAIGLAVTAAVGGHQ